MLKVLKEKGRNEERRELIICYVSKIHSLISVRLTKTNPNSPNQNAFLNRRIVEGNSVCELKEKMFTY